MNNAVFAHRLLSSVPVYTESGNPGRHSSVHRLVPPCHFPAMVNTHSCAGRRTSSTTLDHRKLLGIWYCFRHQRVCKQHRKKHLKEEPCPSCKLGPILKEQREKKEAALAAKRANKRGSKKTVTKEYNKRASKKTKQRRLKQ